MEIQNTDLPASSPVETPKEFYLWDFSNPVAEPAPTPKKEEMYPEDYTKY